MRPASSRCPRFDQVDRRGKFVIDVLRQQIPLELVELVPKNGPPITQRRVLASPNANGVNELQFRQQLDRADQGQIRDAHVLPMTLGILVL